MTTDAMIAVLQAYKEGKTIQYKTHTDLNWSTCVNPRWNFYDFMYRIKPEEPKPKYRPYESAEEVMEDIKKKGICLKYISNSKAYVTMLEFIDGGVWFGTGISLCHHQYPELLKYFTWPDGTPFGIKEE